MDVELLETCTEHRMCSREDAHVSAFSSIGCVEALLFFSSGAVKGVGEIPPSFRCITVYYGRSSFHFQSLSKS